MSKNTLERRDFIKTILAGIPLAAWDWNAFPRGNQAKTPEGIYDAIVIGAGLGGLSCAAAFARQGFKILEGVAEQNGKTSRGKRAQNGTFLILINMGSRVHRLLPLNLEPCLWGRTVG